MAVAGAQGRDRAGGSLGFADPDARVAFGFAMNQEPGGRFVQVAEKRSGKVRPWPPDVTS